MSKIFLKNNLQQQFNVAQICEKLWTWQPRSQLKLFVLRGCVSF